MWPHPLADFVGNQGKIRDLPGWEGGQASSPCLWSTPGEAALHEMEGNYENKEAMREDRRLLIPCTLARGQIQGFQKQVENSTKWVDFLFPKQNSDSVHVN